jgi:hypothetical protein
VTYTIGPVDVAARCSTAAIEIHTQDGTLAVVGTDIFKWVENAS